ncbi:sugar ABC transporter permease [Virgibacillus pantothenticus]|uniref:ABC transporter n=1 Tax=Virgibacillus pantothenticus TaxID=1473 RepID=A0A0L0QM10_VIRPA|nr:carbohydrate ABC transporter permease [Virgibacillus pantothenticus]KNE19591.1 ABC transporter [Virgibacillus pantothenticus]MBU8565844.1 carbohydrate ABC transporter permease [Virgibacillus pantothenticus]MBU8599569.1 carbohydrate ABC transporter permease [Virgibacillus pantothenticus]MBU8634016.1 carbohydrate ABC transporter permease [Virgibacillus pantothenticus]MBU8642056.1 carbohydrate ABC transporter permease [Virgibacillus pantothenticus]
MKNSKKISLDGLMRVFIYVALITLAVSIIVPVAWVFLASIKQNKEFYGSPWSLPEGIHLANFVEAFQEAQMGEYLLNSVLVTAMALLILLLVALPASYALSRFEFRGNRLINSIVKAGLFINVSYIAVPIFLMLLDWDTGLKAMLGNDLLLNNRFMLALIYASTALPFTIYLLSSYFKTLPADFEEAASIDGAGYYRTMFSVMFPMAAPSIVIVILFNFLLFWNEYILALTLMPASNQTLPVGLLNLMAAERSAVNYGPMYAGMVIVMLPTLILYIMVQKRLTQGMTVGGVKG